MTSLDLCFFQIKTFVFLVKLVETEMLSNKLLKLKGIGEDWSIQVEWSKLVSGTGDYESASGKM